MKILANDGISEKGKFLLEKNGFEVITTTIPQEQLENYIVKNKIVALLVRSATKVDRKIIDACNSLKIIGRGGVGMDNIDVKYAQQKGILVINTPNASSESVAELVFAHLYSSVRFLYDANRNMPLEGDTKFKILKSKYSGGIELRGKTLGIIGLGRIGQEVARIAFGIGMKVIANDKYINEKINIKISLFDGQFLNVPITSQPLEKVLKESDFITIHIPAQKDYIIGKKEFKQMKKGAAILNLARGGTVDEKALITALENEEIAFACLDTFENEPQPNIKLLMNPKVSLSPHIGAATKEAQDRIGIELAEKIIAYLKK